jgi:hypothetical protein
MSTQVVNVGSTTGHQLAPSRRRVGLDESPNPVCVRYAGISEYEEKTIASPLSAGTLRHADFTGVISLKVVFTFRQLLNSGFGFILELIGDESQTANSCLRCSSAPSERGSNADIA